MLLTIFYLKEEKSKITANSDVQVDMTYKSISRFLAQNSGFDFYLLYRSTPKHSVGYW